MYRILWVINLSTHHATSSVVLGPARLTSSRNVLVMQNLYPIHGDSKLVFLTRSLMIEKFMGSLRIEVIRSLQHITGFEIIKIYKIKNLLPFLLVKPPDSPADRAEAEPVSLGLSEMVSVEQPRPTPLQPPGRNTHWARSLPKLDLTLLYQGRNLCMAVVVGRSLGGRGMRWSKE